MDSRLIFTMYSAQTESVTFNLKGKGHYLDKTLTLHWPLAHRFQRGPSGRIYSGTVLLWVVWELSVWWQVLCGK